MSNSSLLLKELINKVNSNRKMYTGIGTRHIYDPNKLSMAEKVARRLKDYGYNLRSGHAAGSDFAFEKGSLGGDNEVYLPWKAFNESTKNSEYKNYLDYQSFPDREKELYQTILQKLLAPTHYDNIMRNKDRMSTIFRDIPEVLGRPNLNSGKFENPSDFVLYLANENNGIVDGGTNYAVQLARKLNIPTFNMLQDEEALQKLAKFLSERGK